MSRVSRLISFFVNGLNPGQGGQGQKRGPMHKKNSVLTAETPKARRWKRGRTVDVGKNAQGVFGQRLGIRRVQTRADTVVVFHCTPTIAPQPTDGGCMWYTVEGNKG